MTPCRIADGDVTHPHRIARRHAAKLLGEVGVRSERLLECSACVLLELAELRWESSIDPDATSEERAVAVSRSLSSRRNDVMAGPLTDIGRIHEMTDESQASRLLALAIAALDGGDPKAASELTALAMQFMDRAVSARRATSSVVQQQQQVQPKSDDNED